MKNQSRNPLALPLRARIKRGLSHPKLPWILAGLAVVLTLPALRVGWQLDDYWHRMMFRGWPGYPGLYRSFWDQFTFVNGDPERTQRFLDYGFFPWWHQLKSCTEPWRAVSVLTHWADMLAWPGSPVLMHAHSLLWFGAVVAAAAVLYRRMVSPLWVAGLAALFFAVDDAHGWVVGWLANRNALTSTFFGILTLIAHDRWRRDGSALGAFLAPVWLVLALLSAEAALAVLAYLVAYAWFMDPTGQDVAAVSGGRVAGLPRSKFGPLLALTPCLLVTVVWQSYYKMLGFGAWGLGLYIDPGRTPLRFLKAVVERAPFLLLGQWAVPPSDIYVWLTRREDLWMWTAAVLVLGVIALVMIPALWRGRESRFWALGMAGSAIPICSTLPQDRLLFFVGLGAFPLMAQFVAGVLEGPASEGGRQARGGVRRKASVTLAGAFLFIHLAVAAAALPVRAYSPTIMQQIVDCIETAPLDQTAGEQTAILVNAPSHFYAMYLPVIRSLEGQEPPKYVRSLGPNPESFDFRAVPMTVLRADARTLVIRPEGGYEARPVLRDEDNPLRLGDVIHVTGMTATVSAMSPGGYPSEVMFRFDKPLEDPTYAWLLWKDNTLVRWSPPAIGQTARL